MARQLGGIPFLEASARTGQGVEQAFAELTHQMILHAKETSRPAKDNSTDSRTKLQLLDAKSSLCSGCYFYGNTPIRQDVNKTGGSPAAQSTFSQSPLSTPSMLRASRSLQSPLVPVEEDQQHSVRPAFIRKPDGSRLPLSLTRSVSLDDTLK